MEKEISKELLFEALDDLLKIAAQRQSEKLSSQCRKLQEKLENLSFNLLVLGEFKRGKSTLINALLGADLLPAASIPLTSIVTVGSHSKTPSIKVTFFAGDDKVDSLENLATYVTERENPNNARGVETVNVLYPAPILDSGVRIIDTPGTGSVFAHNTQATLEFLPEADAAIFVFAADQPASLSELELLRMARQYSVKEFLVLNKVDHLDDKGQQESLLFLKQVLDKELNQASRIYPISAKNALALKLGAGLSPYTEPFLDFESAIMQFFLEGKSAALLQSILLKVQALAKEVNDLIDLETAAIAMAPEQLTRALEHFHESSAALLDEQTDAKYIIGGEIRQLLNSIDTDLKEVVVLHADGLRETIDDEFEKHSSQPKELLIETLRISLKSHISEIFNSWVKTEDLKISQRFESLNARFVVKANETMYAIAQTTQKIFNVKVSSQFDIEKLTTKSRHFYAVAHPFSLALEITPLLLPNFLAKRIIKRKFLFATHHELSKNAGRLRADYQERIELSAHQFLQYFQEKVIGALAEIEGVVRRASVLRDSSLEEKAAFERQLVQQQAILESINCLLPKAKAQ